jgi:tetratricopeptide (TPR) repeat protein
MLDRLAEFEYHEGDRTEALRLYEEARPIIHEWADQLKDPRLFLSAGNLAFTTEHREEGQEWWRRAESSARARGDLTGESLAAFNLAQAAERAGDIGAARREYETELAFAREATFAYGIGMSANALGQLALDEGDLESATRYFTEALTAFEESGERVTRCTRGNLTLVAGIRALRVGDTAGARHSFEEALRLFESGPSIPWSDERPEYARKLLASLQDTPALADGAPPSTATAD